MLGYKWTTQRSHDFNSATMMLPKTLKILNSNILLERLSYKQVNDGHDHHYGP